MNPLITVIVPVYNVEKYVNKCIDSLLNQIYDNYEIVIVDDGSTDGSGKIVDMYASNYESIRVFHKENGGLSSARNYGTKQAHGEWVTYVDSDDYVEKTYISDLWSLISNFNADMAIIKIVREIEKGRAVDIIHPDYFPSYITDKKNAFIEIYSGGKVGWSGCGKLLKTDIVLNSPFVDGYYEDCASTYKHVEKCSRIAIGDYRNDYHYIVRDNSILTGEYSQKSKRAFELIQELHEYIDNRYPDLDYVSVSLTMTLVLQIMNLSKMKKSDYNILFYKFKPYFKSKVCMVYNSSDLNMVNKVYLFIMTTNPTILRLFHSMICIIKKIQIRKLKK